MRVVVTGATGFVGAPLVAALRSRGDSVMVLSRDPDRALGVLGRDISTELWDPVDGPAPADALAGADAVVHLAGEPVGQRWSLPARERISASRVVGTRNLVAGLKHAPSRPGVLVCASGAGIYGPRGDEVVDETASPGGGFLASVCVEWEAAASAAEGLGVRVVSVRTGIALERSGGALKELLPVFWFGLGGPVAGGRQYMPWIHLDDVVGLYLAAVDGDASWSGAVNASAPTPVTNAQFVRTLGRVLRRPALLPVPGFALRLLYGEMASVITTGQRMVPARALELGYEFRYPELEGALRDCLAR